MASKVLLDMMDEIIKDMESKTPEELFDNLYSNSDHFKQQWDNFCKNECAKVEIKIDSSHVQKSNLNIDSGVNYKDNSTEVSFSNVDNTNKIITLDIGDAEWLVA